MAVTIAIGSRPFVHQAADGIEHRPEVPFCFGEVGAGNPAHIAKYGQLVQVFPDGFQLYGNSVQAIHHNDFLVQSGQREETVMVIPDSCALF